MTNFKPNRDGFRFEVTKSEESGKRHVAAIDIMYLKGSQRKGVLASVKNIEIEKREGYNMETTVIDLTGNGGFTMWVKELARKSDKHVLQVAEALDSFAPAIIESFIQSSQAGLDTLRAAIEQAVR